MSTQDGSREESQPEAVVVLYYTIMDGPVLRWYRSEAAAERGHEYMSASRNGVYVDAFLDTIPDAEIVKAREAAAELATTQRPDVSRFATHEKPFLARGKVERIVREATS
jgi:hypothetical protein